MNDRPSDRPEPAWPRPTPPSDGAPPPFPAFDPIEAPYEQSRKPLVAASLVLALTLGGLLAWVGVRALSGNSQGLPGTQVDEVTVSPSPSAKPLAPVAATCAYTQVGPASRALEGRPATTVRSTEPAAVTLRTSQGVIELSLDTRSAPCTVNSFIYLTAQKYFDGTS